MPQPRMTAPVSATSATTEVLHGVSVADPYRWLEDQDSIETRNWLEAQRRYARSYLDSIPGRGRIRDRVQELLDVETIDSVLVCQGRYIFRKRRQGQEQPSIWLRNGWDGEEQLLLDPRYFGSDDYTAVRPLQISPDGKLLLFEIKEGGERMGRLQILEIESRQLLPDRLPSGYLRGLAFSPDSKTVYYAYESVNDRAGRRRAAYRHALGTDCGSDREIFAIRHEESLRLQLIPGAGRLGFLLNRIGRKIVTDFYLLDLGANCPAVPLIEGAEYKFGPVLLADGRILAITDLDAPNSRIVEVRVSSSGEPDFVELVSTRTAKIHSWLVTRNRILVSYIHRARVFIRIFGLRGNQVGGFHANHGETLRLAAGGPYDSAVLVERQSFTKPIQLCRYSGDSLQIEPWAQREVPFDARGYIQARVSFEAKDGTRIPMFLAGREDVVSSGCHPTIMTAYGGFGVPMTPQFSVFVVYLMERGCLFALPNIRGGSELGTEWHHAAKRKRKQVAFDDFLCAAEWLIATGHTDAKRLSIFGGSNSGLLVAAAMTQRPDLFAAVISMHPLLDMLRYHRFDQAHLWIDEFGSSEDADDFLALAGYSPYQRVRDGVAYPAVLMVSGDADGNCNPMHARKMTARMQSASSSDRPVLLDYHPRRGHSPVLPLSQRLESLTDRLAFVCDQLGIAG